MRPLAKGLSFAMLYAAVQGAHGAIQLFVEPDCPSPDSNVVLSAYTSTPPVFRSHPLSVLKTGNTFKVVGSLTTNVLPGAPAATLRAAVGPLPAGSYTYDLFTRQESSSDLGPETFQASLSFQVQPDPPPCTPARIRVVAGSNQVAVKGSPFPLLVEVRVVDQAARGVPDLKLNVARYAPPEEYAAGQSAGPAVELSATQLITDPLGNATFTATAGGTEGGVQYRISWTQGAKALLAYVNFGIVAAIPMSSSVPVVEYANVSTGRYFVTADLAEQEVLDGGAIAGWTRTGGTWLAFSHANSTVIPIIEPVCRFFTSGVNYAHFYSALAAECIALRADSFWIEEAPEVFGAVVPLASGCPGGFRPIHRTVRSSEPTGHRYTSSWGLAQYEVANGAIAEGYGNPPAVMCGPR